MFPDYVLRFLMSVAWIFLVDWIFQMKFDWYKPVSSTYSELTKLVNLNRINHDGDDEIYIN